MKKSVLFVNTNQIFDDHFVENDSEVMQEVLISYRFRENCDENWLQRLCESDSFLGNLDPIKI